MSRATLIPPTGARACFHCTAWRNWSTQGISRADSGTIEREPTGQCRALPPSLNRLEIGGTNGDWPVVAASDWCLGFTPAQAAQNGEAA